MSVVNVIARRPKADVAISEFQLINKIRNWLNTKGLVVGIGDDTAAFDLTPGLTTLFTADSLVENVHFEMDSINPVDLGYKSLAVNISDIAAMGGTPKYATVCLGIPKNIKLSFIKNLYKGLNQAADEYKTKIVGGDLSASSQAFISISLIGQVDKKAMLKRSAAKMGDVILVTGSLGKAAISKYSIRPVPRVKEAQLAAQIGVKAAIDISDGLISDCQHVCEQSNVGCTILAEKLPISKTVINFAEKNKLNPLQLALSGGEDYELIFTASKKIASQVINKFKSRRWPISLIGEITKSKTIQVLNETGKPIKWEKGYEHKFN